MCSAVLQCSWILQLCIWLLIQTAHSIPLEKDGKNLPGINEFKIYWNIPSFVCKKYGIDFEELATKHNTIHNLNDKFQGEKIALLYEPGYFPALINEQGEKQFENGGVPQEGNLTLHLERFREEIAARLPDPKFSGLGIIDFESWRPIFRQNWSKLQPYRDYSIELERKKHPDWSKTKLEKEATKRFEAEGWKYMNKTLEEARKLRPNALWGFYAYPYCFDDQDKGRADCDAKAVLENDGMTWVFDDAKVLYPSLYLSNKLNTTARITSMKSKLKEAIRVSKKPEEPAKVIPYFWYKYSDNRDTFVDEDDLIKVLMELILDRVDGMILWGSTNSDFQNESDCRAVKAYLEETFFRAVSGVFTVMNVFQDYLPEREN